MAKCALWRRDTHTHTERDTHRQTERTSDFCCLAQVPDYYDVISNPIDLTAMKEKCEDDVYTSAQQFVDDMALLFDNGDMYNKVTEMQVSIQVHVVLDL